MNFLVFIQISLIACSTFQKLILKENASEKVMLLNAFSEAINELFVENSIDFDVIVYDGAKKSILNEIGRKAFGNYSYELKIVESKFIDPCFSLSNSAIIIVDDDTALNDFNFHARLTNIFPKPLRFLVWINHMTFPILVKSEDFLYDDFGDITQYEYVLFEMLGSIQMLTFDWFRDDFCNSLKFLQIDEFDINLRKWTNGLKTHKKFRNFHGCRLIANLAEKFRINSYHDLRTNSIKGLLVDLFDAMGQKGNFSTAYTPFIRIHLQTEPYCMNEKVQNEISVSKYQVMQALKSHSSHYHVTSPFRQTSFIFLITPSEPITISEKLFLPFDFMTWIMLTITFGIALSVILIANFLPICFRNLIFGKGVETPGINVCYIFFGIGQMKVPDKSFPRFLLMTFILFCLIFRTCYQSKLFEFMTSDMRKLSPITIDELYENDFKIVTVYYPGIADHLTKMIDEKRR